MTEPVLRMCLALAMAASGAVAGVQAWEAVHEGAAETLQQVQASNDAQLVRAAQIANALSRGGVAGTDAQPTASELEALVRAGYLQPEFLTRERVNTAPLDLPEVPDDAPDATQ